LLCRTVSYCTVNKLLVPEWPCIIEVSYIYSSYICIIKGPSKGICGYDPFTSTFYPSIIIRMINKFVWNGNVICHWILLLQIDLYCIRFYAFSLLWTMRFFASKISPDLMGIIFLGLLFLKLLHRQLMICFVSVSWNTAFEEILTNEHRTVRKNRIHHPVYYTYFWHLRSIYWLIKHRGLSQVTGVYKL
jgi:hypothetical protein